MLQVNIGIITRKLCYLFNEGVVKTKNTTPLNNERMDEKICMLF